MQDQINTLFARAETAFREGRYDAARDDLRQVSRLAGEHPAVLHLMALNERHAGQDEAAADAFRRALRAAPRDPQILNNYANLLDATGDPDGALDHYSQAIRARGDFADAHLNRAILLDKLGRFAEALVDVDRALVLAPGLALALATRGGLLRRLDRLADSAAAFDAALAAAPGNALALHGRARVALERGEPDSPAIYRQALGAAPGDFDVILGYAQAMDMEGDPEGRAMLGRVLDVAPDWVAGHEMLARLRAESDEDGDIARSYHAALAQLPDDRALHHSYWTTLARAGRHAEAVGAIARARTVLREDDALVLTEAVIAAEAGDLDLAGALFDQLPESPDRDLGAGRLALRTGEPELAVRLLERVVAVQDTNIAAWAHLGLAWRLTGNPRQAWLNEQAGLYGATDIGLTAAEIEDVAALARELHKSHAQPIGQSLRGGTQTRGRLFSRTEPQIARLAEALREAIAGHIAGLPPHDATHPLLRHRDARFEFDGAWSVRLTSGGFHINHIHPQGILSSAFYVSLPDAVGQDADRPGWLELGAAPVELGLSLAPLATIEPKPGRLALFPSYLFHGTRPFADGERLTVAFDLVPR